MFTRRKPFPASNAMHSSALACSPWALDSLVVPPLAQSARSIAEVAKPAPAKEAQLAQGAQATSAAKATKAPADERALSARALAGDVDAWNALITRHDHRVVVSLLARGVRIDRAKDIAQEAWMRLVEQQRAGKLTHLSLPGLAIAQAAFLSLEAARRDGARAPALSIDADDGTREASDLVDPAADAETRLLTSERVEQAEQVLAGCSPSARNVFRLAYGGDGLSHAEVAKQVGLSLQRVRQILCEVRSKLRVALEGEGT
jgi:RNA polymerase sigma-70 factor (ECF subfamily)